MLHFEICSCKFAFVLVRLLAHSPAQADNLTSVVVVNPKVSFFCISVSTKVLLCVSVCAFVFKCIVCCSA